VAKAVHCNYCHIVWPSLRKETAFRYISKYHCFPSDDDITGEVFITVALFHIDQITQIKSSENSKKNALDHPQLFAQQTTQLYGLGILC
jgi:hypothetical protein